MSQKVRIERVDVVGATPFLGLSDNSDPDSTRLYSRNGETIMAWLAAAWRYRFNAHRSQRSTYGPHRTLLLIGDRVDTRSDSASRRDCSWLAAVPAMVLQSPEKLEKQEWFAAAKRRTTLRMKGLDPGRMPRFRSRNDDQIFCCWFNKGANARFDQVSRRHGIVSIAGVNPRRYRRAGEPARFRIRIHVRTSEAIRDYTSVRVNATRHTLVFVNDPLPVDRVRTHRQVGLDRGVVHQLATDTGEFMDLPAERLKSIDTRVRAEQRAAARAVRASGKSATEYVKNPSGRYRRHQAEIARLKALAARITVDRQQKWTTRLVRDHDLIVTEDLSLRRMTGTPAPVPDPTRPGRFLPNGRASKRGLNRVLAGAALSRVQQMLVYKAARSGVELVEVPAAYTSQACSRPGCDCIAPENRKSQAVFRCIKCGLSLNADTNAARNILALGLASRPGMDRETVYYTDRRAGHALAAEGHETTAAGTSDTVAVPMTREPQQSHL